MKVQKAIEALKRYILPTWTKADEQEWRYFCSHSTQKEKITAWFAAGLGG